MDTKVKIRKAQGAVPVKNQDIFFEKNYKMSGKDDVVFKVPYSHYDDSQELYIEIMEKIFEVFTTFSNKDFSRAKLSHERSTFQSGESMYVEVTGAKLDNDTGVVVEIDFDAHIHGNEIVVEEFGIERDYPDQRRYHSRLYMIDEDELENLDGYESLRADEDVWDNITSPLHDDKSDKDGK